MGFWASLLAAIVAGLAALAVPLRPTRTLGGHTGDVLGAVQVIAEMTALAAIAAIE